MFFADFSLLFTKKIFLLMKEVYKDFSFADMHKHTYIGV